jgi:hypothetical protein
LQNPNITHHNPAGEKQKKLPELLLESNSALFSDKG